ncbi:hypothetical protein TSAR_004955 [Trichomalopsis sarcophagae]|uniref:DUF7041 domain-containing protein n=1 Tax=Trichomalopsis sarcophagae TaxID=543379 RepID=A0A232EIW1_9HYME|nr:hypothetical protein TSAR_004955 [Trichomalopsis sarcophagae]
MTNTMISGTTSTTGVTTPTATTGVTTPTATTVATEAAVNTSITQTLMELVLITPSLISHLTWSVPFSALTLIRAQKFFRRSFPLASKCKLGFRAPVLIPNEPELWFTQFEQNLANAGITTETTKFSYLAKIQHKIMEQLRTAQPAGQFQIAAAEPAPNPAIE